MQLYHNDPGIERGTFSPLHFDTAGFDEAHTRDLCTELLSGVVGSIVLDAEADGLKGLHGMLCQVDDLSVTSCFFPPKSLHIRGEGRQDCGRILMLRSMEGPLSVKQNGLRVEAQSGDFLFLSGERPFTWSLPEGGRVDCGSVPAHSFGMPPEAIDRLLLRPIPKSFPPLQLLITYGAYLLMRGPHSLKEAEMANTHFNEILPLVIAYLDRQPKTVSAAGRLLPVKDYINTNLIDSDLHIGSVAAVLGVTPRYVQKLFQQEGTTFSRYLLDRRLTAAKKRLLQNNGAKPISAIAYDVGFGDLSYFNRTFRKRYGMAPSSVGKARIG
ncbi:helix-turn-helix transcriptional regulator [Pararhizobium sp. DWP1-1-3]|uniref:helix-turn-helix transcriptional regulator n=1 Tax=Pararhizobium sp. DWP1-1-3 TaxID=2804652 RepID=UPI003CF65492